MLATGFTAETIVFRKYVENLVDSISGEGWGELEIDNSTMETLRNLECILKLISLNNLTYVSRAIPIASESIKLVLSKFKNNIRRTFTSPD